MPYAFNTKAKALDFITPFNRDNPAWTAKLNIGRAVGHTQIVLYANNRFVGVLQGDILGSALYKEKNSNGVEGNPISLTWQKVLDGVDEVYRHPTAWGTWFCHDITAAVFRRWGLNGQDVYRAAYDSTPGGRGGLVAARLVALLGVPGTTVILGGHEAWNAFQDAWRNFKNAANPSSWRFRLW
jgi:hypothetical protein